MKSSILNINQLALFFLFLELTNIQMFEAKFPVVKVLFLSEILSTLTYHIFS